MLNANEQLKLGFEKLRSEEIADEFKLIIQCN